MEAFDKFQGLEKGSDEFNRILKNDVLESFGNEPEYFRFRQMGPPLYVLPKVTSLFELHDLQMEASAEPLPLESGQRTGKQYKTYQAALVLSRLNLDWSVELAIEQLEKVKYEIGNLDEYARETLLGALENVF